MKLLLDTRVILWWLAQDAALSEAAAALIGDVNNSIYVSAVSTWEIWWKKSLGKLEIPDDFQVVLDFEEFHHLPLTAVQTRAVASLPWHHRDPFDRMLIAQAQVAGLTLLTADERLLAYGSFVRRV